MAKLKKKSGTCFFLPFFSFPLCNKPFSSVFSSDTSMSGALTWTNHWRKRRAFFIVSFHSASVLPFALDWMSRFVKTKKINKLPEVSCTWVFADMNRRNEHSQFCYKLRPDCGLVVHHNSAYTGIQFKLALYFIIISLYLPGARFATFSFGGRPWCLRLWTMMAFVLVVEYIYLRSSRQTNDKD